MTQPSFVPVKVHPQDSVSKDHLIDNIGANLDLIKEWIQVGVVDTSKTGWIISAGPSLDRCLENGFFDSSMFPLNDTRHKVFCVKHSLPKLVNAGIIPYACILLDPRPLDGVSTHGIVRRDLFKEAPKETIYLVASMTNPKVTEHLLEKGLRVVGWHAAVQGIEKFQDRIPWAIGGGTASALRGLGLLNALGFRKINLVGIDCSQNNIPDNPDEVDEASGKPKYLKVQYEGKEFWSTPELVALTQDMQAFLKEPSWYQTSETNLVGTDPDDSLMGAIWRRENLRDKLYSIDRLTKRG